MMSGKKKNKSMPINPENYTRKDAVYMDGEWWYIQPGDGNRRRVTSHAKKNTSRMFVNGRYIPKSHPLHKPGRYRALDDAWSHEEIEKTKEGYVYAIVNPAWPNWAKIGKAVNAEDRLNNYQTGSPYRDYKILASLKSENRHDDEKAMHKLFDKYSLQRKGEWFNISEQAILLVFEDFNDSNSDNSADS
jgi:hypothetical protein